MELWEYHVIQLKHLLFDIQTNVFLFLFSFQFTLPTIKGSQNSFSWLSMLFSYAQEYSPLCFHKVPIMLENSPNMIAYNGELCLLQKAFVWLAHKLSGYLGSWFVSRAVQSSLYQIKPVMQCLKFEKLITAHGQFIHLESMFIFCVNLNTNLAMQEMISQSHRYLSPVQHCTKLNVKSLSIAAHLGRITFIF